MSVIKSNHYNILINEDIAVLKSSIEQLNPTKVFILVDENSKKHCLPYIEEKLKLNFTAIQVPAGEKYKNLQTCSGIWQALVSNQADRNCLLINLGGGVIGDMGGFAASCFMRGVRFIQLPTTLLSQVDASAGGKVGIDFLDYKNMIGAFSNPELVWINTDFLSTLPFREIKSGFAEVIKHALIKSEEYWKKITSAPGNLSLDNWHDIIQQSVHIKNEITRQDPYEKGIRKILNFGHTIGHAIESFYLKTDKRLLHGESVAIGMICEAHLSYQCSLINDAQLKEVSLFIHKIFPIRKNLVNNFDDIYELMKKDKKNFDQKISFSLLNGIGDCSFNHFCNRDAIMKSFAYYENSFN